LRFFLSFLKCWWLIWSLYSYDFGAKGSSD
jgi:hypothetical protein